MEPTQAPLPIDQLPPQIRDAVAEVRAARSWPPRGPVSRSTIFIHQSRDDYRPCYVYRVFAEGGELLYIGSGRSVHGRLADHAQNRQSWFPLAHRVEIEEYEDEREARAVERDAVLNEKPLGNMVWTERHHKGIPAPAPEIVALRVARGID